MVDAHRTEYEAMQVAAVNLGDVGKMVSFLRTLDCPAVPPSLLP